MVIPVLTLFWCDFLVARRDAVLGMALIAGQVPNFPSDFCYNLHSCGSTADNTNVFSAHVVVFGPFWQFILPTPQPRPQSWGSSQVRPSRVIASCAAAHIRVLPPCHVMEEPLPFALQATSGSSTPIPMPPCVPVCLHSHQPSLCRSIQSLRCVTTLSDQLLRIPKLCILQHTWLRSHPA